MLRHNTFKEKYLTTFKGSCLRMYAKCIFSFLFDKNLQNFKVISDKFQVIGNCASRIQHSCSHQISLLLTYNL
jgi:hypothetical protein